MSDGTLADEGRRTAPGIDDWAREVFGGGVSNDLPTRRNDSGGYSAVLVEQRPGEIGR